MSREINGARQEEKRERKIIANNARIQVLLDEKNFLNNVKRAMAVKECRDFVLWILRQTDPLEDAYDGSAKTYYSLGKQRIGKEITRVLTEAECDLDVTDISDKLKMSKDKREMMDREITKLKTENEEAKKQC